MDVFDPSEISNAFIRGQYERLLRRGQSTADAVHRAYGADRRRISMRYVSGESFNAHVTGDNVCYQVQISSGVPVLLIILFYKIFENPILLPELSADSTSSTVGSLPFIVDPAHIDRREEWNLNLNGDRAIAADFFADICMTFVINHEIGHILSGHVEGYRHYDGERSYPEMASYRPTRIEDRRRRQAWEIEADFIAATLLMNYVRELDRHCRIHEHTKKVFFRGEGTVAHILAATVAALVATFSYMRGSRYRLNNHTFHPHPMVRGLYIKDALVRAATQQWDFDEERFLTLMDDRLNEMLTALQEIGLSDNWRFTEEYLNQINKRRSEVDLLRLEFRSSCKSWSWITWSS